VTSLWTYHETVSRETPDLTGYEVEAVDGRIGTVDECSTEVGSQRLVVDTGWWIFGHKRVIPAGVVTRIDPTARTVHLSLTKEQVKGAPDYDEMRAGEPDYWDDMARYYGD
jgi:hypothetical protein